MVVTPPVLLDLGDQAAEVPRRPRVPGGLSQRQQPLGRDLAVRRADLLGDQINHLVVVVFPLLAAQRLVPGQRPLDDAFDGLVRGAAHLCGATVGAYLPVSGDDVHDFPRRFHSRADSLSGDLVTG